MENFVCLVHGRFVLWGLPLNFHLSGTGISIDFVSNCAVVDAALTIKLIPSG